MFLIFVNDALYYEIMCAFKGVTILPLLYIHEDHLQYLVQRFVEENIFNMG